MTTPQNSAQERFENLEILRQAAWESIEARRKYEWKISLAFWGLLGSFIYAVAKKEIVFGGSIGCELWVFPIALTVAHLIWMFGLFHAYSVDKRAEQFFRKQMRATVQLLEPEYQNCTGESDVAAARSRGPLTNWNTGAQLLVTLALGFLAVRLVLLR